MGLGFCRSESASLFERQLVAEREVWAQLEGISRRASNTASEEEREGDLRQQVLFCFSILHRQYQYSASYILNRCGSTPGIVAFLHPYPRRKGDDEDSLLEESVYQKPYILDVYFGSPEQWKNFKLNELGIQRDNEMMTRLFNCGFDLKH